jgi:hypothetical protein
MEPTRSAEGAALPQGRFRGLGRGSPPNPLQQGEGRGGLWYPPRIVSQIRSGDSSLIGQLEFSDSAKHRQRELVFRVLNIVTAIDDEPLSVLQDFADDDDLVRHIASDPVSVQEVNDVEQRRLHVPAQLVEGGSIQPCAAIPVIDVLFHENITGLFDLAFHVVVDFPEELLAYEAQGSSPSTSSARRRQNG